MNPFLKFETYFVSLVVGGLAHFQALHPGVVDPFYSGVLVGCILHALNLNGANGTSPSAPPRVGGST